MFDRQSIINNSRKALLAYCGVMNPNYDAPDHLVELAKILHGVERGDLKRVIITIPPRHGKSMLISQYFPAWYMGRNPDKYIITTSYGQNLSDDFGRKVRDQLEDPLFKEVFPECHISSQSHSANRFETKEGGTYYAVGAGGAITGRGAHLFLIDDPIKNREDAESPTKAHKLKEWYKSVAYTRLMPGAAICVVMQRWNNDDLVGWLLEEQKHENWTVFNMPAINKMGNSLWPECFPLPTLNKIKETIGSYNWASQYQQQPINSETQVLDHQKITGYDQLPKMLMTLTACDPAISKDSRACNTAFCTLGYGEDGHIYDLETIAGKWSFFETLEQANMVLKRQRSRYLGVESNQYQQALAEALTRYFPNVHVVDIRADKDKFRRAKGVSHFVEKGIFHTNNRELLDEIRAFDPMITGEAKKDRVDALVHALTLIQRYAPIEMVEPKKQDPYAGMDSHQAFFKKTREYAKKQFSDSNVEVFNESEMNIDANYY